MKKRGLRRFSAAVFGLCLSLLYGVVATAADNAELKVYKSPTCGCCTKWIEHLEQQGLQATGLHPTSMPAVKQHFGIAPAYRSCHTGVSTEGYVFEGHVPAKFIRQFLASPPEGAIGLSVPGMPVGSPGMEVDQRFDAYQVLLLMQDGKVEIYQAVNSSAEQY
ncbi:DUF411 domain-containing protein [Pontibacter sp. JAM-7]|uniref:DUF411 domain-containing protein n=1 Tax=Pontibacter sp. JAM-7 TaxID=3366581 RepID=UPI003AF57C66